MAAETRIRQGWRRGQHGWPERYPLVQLPNAPLFVAIGGWVVAALTHSSAHDYARGVFYAGLSAWAWEELAGGVNGARRALGLAGLAYVVVKVGEALGG